MIEFFKTLSITDWVGLIGGLSGLVSSGAYFYDRITNGPKVVSKVTSANVYERAPSQSDQWYNYDFTIEVEISNTGTKLTSLIKPKLHIQEIETDFNLQFASEHPMGFGKSSVTLDAGFADTYTFRCVKRSENKIDLTSFNGIIEFKQSSGSLIRHQIVFEK